MLTGKTDDPEELLKLAAKAALEAGAEIMNVYGGDHFSIRIKADDSPVTIADLGADNIIFTLLSESGLPVLSEERAPVPYKERRSWKRFWLVDPLDGTKEFISRNGEFTVNIALIEDSEPLAGVVYAPVSDVLYAGIVGGDAWRFDRARDTALSGWPAAGRPLPCVRKSGYGIVASRSFPDDLTLAFIDEFISRYPGTQVVNRGSSLKLCMLAEGSADIYPRFRNISEWDTAAGHAVLLASGGSMVQAASPGRQLVYNKEESRNPWFIAYRDRALLDAVLDMIPTAS